MGEDNPGYRAPISSMVSLTCLKSCNNLHFPAFFLITKMGQFQGEFEGAMCPFQAVPAPAALRPLFFLLLGAIDKPTQVPQTSK